MLTVESRKEEEEEEEEREKAREGTRGRGEWGGDCCYGYFLKTWSLHCDVYLCSYHVNWSVANVFVSMYHCFLG